MIQEDRDLRQSFRLARQTIQKPSHRHETFRPGYNHLRMALSSGTKLGPYEIQSPLGAGGMGEVYRAKDTRLDRIVAIKVLPSHLSSDPELKQRMEREAKAISALQHPNICTLHDIGAQDGTNYLVMEYLEGQTLAERLTKGALPLDVCFSCIDLLGGILLVETCFSGFGCARN